MGGEEETMWRGNAAWQYKMYRFQAQKAINSFLVISVYICFRILKEIT